MQERQRSTTTKKCDMTEGGVQQFADKKYLSGVTVKPGYTQTEVGVIPEDWVATKLGEIVSFTNGKAHENVITDYGVYTVVNSKFISTEGEVAKQSNSCFCSAAINDILMVMSDVPNGRAIAKCFLVNKNNFYAVNQRVCVVRPKGVHPKLLFYKLDRNQFYLSFDDGVKQTNLKKSDVLACPLALPSNNKEQTAIATALSDVDALITSLDQLIAKKRDIKQATMQQLLTGKKRLAGLSGKWEVKQLGDVAEIIGGGTPSTFVSSYWNGTINWFTPTEIGIKKYSYESERKITKNGLEDCSARILPIGTILLTSRAGIGDVSILMQEGCTNQGFQSLISKDGYDNEYLYYLLLTLKKELLQNASGSTFLEINPNKLKKIEIFLPDYKTQTHIANILSDMDADINLLEAKRNKTIALKQGMMQELLTGRIRLI